VVTGRFAPSPTGPLHLGNLRTALVAWLCARAAGGRFLVRVEDLDPVASRPEHEAGQLADLGALGLAWDGGIVRQSDRRAAHDAAVAQLEAQGLLYPCYCTRREVQAASQAPHGELPEGAYPGTCRSLTPADRREREATGRRPSWRLRAGGRSVTFVDRVHGETTGVVDDLVVRRTDGVPAYNLAVVVDDAWQGVTQVVRGDDLLLTTPRQLLLAELLHVQSPSEYVHVPLVLGPDGRRLAKRDGAVTLADQMARGRTAAEVLALLGSSLGLCSEDEHVTAALLAGRFRVSVLDTVPWTVPPGWV
jgi:glutamyl-tRNA synthetase